MSDREPSSGRDWSYKFTRPDGSELETQEFGDDDTAETHARELSTAQDTPVVVHRHSAHIDSWDYVTEVDDRR